MLFRFADHRFAPQRFAWFRWENLAVAVAVPAFFALLDEKTASAKCSFLRQYLPSEPLVTYLDIFVMPLFLWLFSWLLPAAAIPLELTVTTSANATGDIHLAVYDCAEGFLARKEILQGSKAAQRGGTVAFQLDLPHAGNYVLAAFHDLNGNGQLDTNVFGAPTEPYGFSEPSPSRWREPAFSEIASGFFEDADRSDVVIVLKRWKDH